MKLRNPLQADCIIPAAGISSRMGRWKLMLPFSGKPIINNTVGRALQEVDHIIVVTGYRSDVLISHLRQTLSPKQLDRIDFAVNSEYGRGMFSSIQTGLRKSTSEIVFILHADLPCIPSELFRKLFMEYERSADMAFGNKAEVLRPVYNRVPGHPVLLTASAKERILAMHPEASMQEAFGYLTVKEINIESSGIIEDIDTPEAYQKLIRKM